MLRFKTKMRNFQRLSIIIFKDKFKQTIFSIFKFKMGMMIKFKFKNIIATHLQNLILQNLKITINVWEFL